MARVSKNPEGFIRSKYVQEYQKKKYKSVVLHFDRENDKKVIEKLDSKNNKIEYIRELINTDIQKEHKNNTNEFEKNDKD